MRVYTGELGKAHLSPQGQHVICLFYGLIEPAVQSAQDGMTPHGREQEVGLPTTLRELSLFMAKLLASLALLVLEKSTAEEIEPNRNHSHVHVIAGTLRQLFDHG